MEPEKPDLDSICLSLANCRALWAREQTGDPNGSIWLERMESMEATDLLIKRYIYGADHDQIVQPCPGTLDAGLATSAQVIAESVSRETPARASGVEWDHILKSWPWFFAPLLDGTGAAEVRLGDRNFKSGDRVLFREYDPTRETYSGREHTRSIANVIHVGALPGIDGSYVLLTLRAAHSQRFGSIVGEK